jgi:D-psicose/D-tagatose/L-ribulose 3-epimerase
MVLIGAHTFAWSPGITDAELDPLFAELAGTAIDFVELASYDLEGLTPAAIRRVSAASGLPVTLCSGLPGGLSLASADASCRRQAQDHVRRLIEFALACGALKLSGPIHGDLSQPASAASGPDDWQRLLDSYGELSHDLAQSGLPFSIEPLNRYQSSLLNTLEQTEALCQAIGVETVGILADLFHANLEQGHLYNDLEAHRPDIRHVHICGANRGPIGRCHLDWPRLMRWIADFPATTLMSIETFNAEVPLLARRTRTWRQLGAPAPSIVLEGAAYLKQHLPGAWSP